MQKNRQYYSKTFETMRKLFLSLSCIFFILFANAQDEVRYIYLHNSGDTLANQAVSNINSIKFANKPASAIFTLTNGQLSYLLTQIDSLTFGMANVSSDAVTIDFSSSSVTVNNPFPNDGIIITTDGTDVTVENNRPNTIFSISGSCSNGSLDFTGTENIYLILNSLELTHTSGPVLKIEEDADAYITLNGTSVLSDGSSGKNAAITSEGSLYFYAGTGEVQISGFKKHAVKVTGDIAISSGTVQITEAASDGLHLDGDFTLSGDGNLVILETTGDGVDCGNNIYINGGNLNLTTSAEDVKGLKANYNIYFNGGESVITTSGAETKAIKSDSAIYINNSSTVLNLTLSNTGVNGISCDSIVNITGGNITINSTSEDGKGIKADIGVIISGGNIEINHSGDMSKGISTNGYTNISGGVFTITSSGGTVLETSGSGYEPSYCSGIKSDGDITISGGTFNITLPTSNNGGKAISSDANITISDGTFTLTTNGAGAVYTNPNGITDSYTCSCIKCDGNLTITGGNITCTSTGSGGKGIKLDGVATFGTIGGNDDDFILTITTSGERFYVSGSGWNMDYANPKALKSDGTMTINSGHISSNCLQTQNEGGEAIECESVMTINGGIIEAFSNKDDGMNPNQLIVNDGKIYTCSNNGDGIDVNGPMTYNGGMVIATGSGMPECGLDCDQNTFKITGGIIIGAGGSTSNPTTSVCTQPTLKINTRSGYAIQVLSGGEVICTYQCPTISGGGPGGGRNLVLLLSHPSFSVGSSYTVKYGGTISGGTYWHGYYTDATYSGGQSTTVTISSMLTNVNAGGGGWPPF